MEIVIYFLSTVIAGIGIYQVRQATGNWLVKLSFVLVAIMVFMNALDVFVAGNQTTHRQVAYLMEALAIVYFSFKSNSSDKISA